MRTENFNPGLLDRAFIGGKIAETGAKVIFLGDGIKRFLSFDEIFKQSLLGVRLGLSVNPDSLSDYERKIMELNYHILTISDWDGVFANPLLAVFNKNERKISLDAFRVLKKLSRASDDFYLLTSRFDAEEIREQIPFLRGLINFFQNGAIDFFPFLGGSSVTRLEKFGDRFKGKKGEGVGVLSGKSLNVFERKEQLEKLIEDFLERNGQNSVAYIIGSSVFDRRAVLGLCQKDKNLAQKIIYIDMGHLIF